MDTQEATEWVNEENMMGEHFQCGDTVMAIHARQVDGHWQHAVTRWWYGTPYVLAVFEEDKMLWSN